MATKFLEPGGDATFNVATTLAGGFWSTVQNTTLATDFTNGVHSNSLSYGTSGEVITSTSVAADAGTRISFYLYVVAFPTVSSASVSAVKSSGSNRFLIQLTTSGVLQLWNNNGGFQLGTNGSLLSTGQWYRISLAYTIGSTTVNEFRLFKDGLLDISVTNASVSATGGNEVHFGNTLLNSGLNIRTSDHYVDNSNSLTDPGNIFVTARRPNANGTTNAFNVQIGSGGSGYGSGHSPQVNELPLSNTNGWSTIAVGATTEEYTIDDLNGKDDLNTEDNFHLLLEDGTNLLQEISNTTSVDLTTATIVDYMGWIDIKTVLSESPSIILNGVNTAVTTTANTEGMFTAFANSTTYPAGTGTDIGILTDTTATTVSLYECGVVVAYIPTAPPPPPAPTVSPIQEFMLMGVGT